MPASTYTALYAFGDSLADAGNVSILTAVTSPTPVSPPYFSQSYGIVSGTVFSNGPTWVQSLSTALGLGTLAPSLAGGNDFAYGSAETGSTPQNSSITTAALSLPAQITQFEAAVSRQQAAGALFAVSIGGNDILDILADRSLSTDQQTADINAAVANEIGFLQRLAADGAGTIAVMNVPDLGKTPDVVFGLATGTGVADDATNARATALSAQYNAALASQLATVGARTVVVDAYGLIDSAVANPIAYGLTNVVTPVWDGNFTNASNGNLASTDRTVQNQSLFFDVLHPTQTGHDALATSAEQALFGGTAGAAVTALYRGILQRAPEVGAFSFWGDAVDARGATVAQVGTAIATSPEAAAYVVPVVELYTALGRAPDQGGLRFWVQALERGTALGTIGAGFLSSGEGTTIFGNAAGTGTQANSAFVTTTYRQMLGRAADAGGLQNWTGLLDSGALRPGDVLANFALSAEAQVRDGAAVTSFLLAAGTGVANYGGDLFANRPIV